MSGTAALPEARVRGSQGVPSRHEPSDEEIIAALRSGESGAAEALYRKLFESVRRAVRTVLRDRPADHDDLIQVAFERIIKSIVAETYRGECKLRRWATAIATRAAIDHQRAISRERLIIRSEGAFNLEADYHQSVPVEPSLIARSELEQLRAILLRMRPLDAQVLILRHGFGYTLGETAEAMGASEMAVSSRLARARRELVRRANAAIARGGASPLDARQPAWA